MPSPRPARGFDIAMRLHTKPAPHNGAGFVVP
ncbi:hypothetical protein SAMN05428989_3507 [Pseudoxanthomonas sp. GM95]|nr:hypothetical protein SAMN05428989_3507 [Pseudoxanthomonas sp. GM95]